MTIQEALTNFLIQTDWAPTFDAYNSSILWIQSLVILMCVINAVNLGIWIFKKGPSPWHKAATVLGTCFCFISLGFLVTIQSTKAELKSQAQKYASDILRAVSDPETQVSATSYDGVVIANFRVARSTQQKKVNILGEEVMTSNEIEALNINVKESILDFLSKNGVILRKEIPKESTPIISETQRPGPQA